MSVNEKWRETGREVTITMDEGHWHRLLSVSEDGFDLHRFGELPRGWERSDEEGFQMDESSKLLLDKLEEQLPDGGW